MATELVSEDARVRDVAPVPVRWSLIGNMSVFKVLEVRIDHTIRILGAVLCLEGNVVPIRDWASIADPVVSQLCEQSKHRVQNSR
eukprot:CAMPEP_0202808860 /NCGR_PEP_ID=MMETSP1389-20130828/1298_1 /ASSEMBLY_ACC=CAM_ASM_000865 /TAXON_ID=302021 /ORGANISM="Rhodomonas sp., Strain CCMP768" /LENGTH=84 /DNA_ID=CAMNT_0049479291 /DNA_START=116 /DNA_END=366 /DNA_ORIENTATION=+